MAKKKMMMGDMYEDEMMGEDPVVSKRTKKHMQDMSCDQPECGDMGMMNSEMRGMMSSDKSPPGKKKKGKK